jgi:hypothetical protein
MHTQGSSQSHEGATIEAFFSVVRQHPDQSGRKQCVVVEVRQEFQDKIGGSRQLPARFDRMFSLLSEQHGPRAARDRRSEDRRNRRDGAVDHPDERRLDDLRYEVGLFAAADAGDEAPSGEAKPGIGRAELPMMMCSLRSWVDLLAVCVLLELCDRELGIDRVAAAQADDRSVGRSLARRPPDCGPARGRRSRAGCL